MIRLDRARIAPDKDKTKAAQIEPFEFELARFDSQLRAETRSRVSDAGQSVSARVNSENSIASPISEEKRAAVEELRWMIEEFKLALFAPEIKTAFPISAVRLARKIAEIEALT